MKACCVESLSPSYYPYLCCIAGSILFVSVYFNFPSIVTKFLPVVAVSILSFFYGKGQLYSKLISIGLLFGALGDIFLEINNGSFVFFIAGMISFLMGHLFYCAAYRTGNTLNPQQHILVLVLFLCYYGALIGVLIPFLDVVMIPAIILYGGVLCTMALFATLRLFHVNTPLSSRALAFVGSLFFVASDSTLSINKFREPIPESGMVIMITYYVAQVLIAMSSFDAVAVHLPESLEESPEDSKQSASTKPLLS